MSYLELAERALGQRRRPEEAQESRPKEEEIARLRSRLGELRQRIDKGFEVLRFREQAGKTGHPYPLWLEVWGKLLRECEETADRLASLTGCPIGDCSRMGLYQAARTACPLSVTLYRTEGEGQTSQAIWLKTPRKGGE